MSDIAFRTGKKVVLRPFERADVPTLRRWMNDPEVTQYLTRTYPIGEKEEEEWVENMGKDKNNVALAMVDRDKDTLIGSIGIHAIRWEHRSATTGTVIGEKGYWGKGFGTEAKMLLLDLAFNVFGLEVVLSRAYAFNERSQAYSKKCGYEEVGRIPGWLRKMDGSGRCDEVLLLVTSERWRPLWLAYQAQRQKEAAAGE